VVDYSNTLAVFQRGEQFPSAVRRTIVYENDLVGAFGGQNAFQDQVDGVYFVENWDNN
jgi:hypothetical protein